MEKPKRLLIFALMLVMLAGFGFSPAPAAAQSGEPVLVGRIAHVEGELLRYVPDEQDWVATVKDAPFGLDDALYSDQAGKAEFIMPNETWIRIGGSTQIQLITLKSDVTEADVASGIARFYNKSADGVIKATTPFGYALAEPDSAFDLYVGDQSAELIALRGNVDFVHEGDQARYDVHAGAGSIIADANQVASGTGEVDADWDDWNTQRDSTWAKRVDVKGESVRNLPPELGDDAYDLDENGRWETVNYEGAPRSLWRPTSVAAGWAPFTVGRWTEWYGDNCWVPDEPFGYVTHHYGNWVLVNGVWYWASPAVVHMVAATPAADLGFGWYPGRVAWIHTDTDIGWVPLAPAEPYYAHRPWGPRAIVVTGAVPVSISIGALAFVSGAVVVPQTDFYGVRSYSAVRVRNINTATIVGNYRPAPVVNNTVIKNYSTTHNRYNFTTTQVAAKPHQEVVSRIQQNRQISEREAKTVSARTVKQNVAALKPAAPAAKPARMEKPKVTNKIVPAAEMNKPKSEVKFQQQEMKQKAKPAPAAVTLPGAKPGAMPGRAPAPGQPGQVQPARPGQPPVQPGMKPQAPAGQPAPGQPERPAPPAKPGERMQPAEPAKPQAPGQVPPARPGVQPAPPAKPGEPAKPGVTGEPAGPARPGEKVQPQPGMKPQEPAAPRQPAAPAPQMQERKPQMQPEQPKMRQPEAAPQRQPAAPAPQPQMRPQEKQIPPQQTIEPRRPQPDQQMRQPQQRAPEQPRPGAAPQQQQQQQKQKPKPGEENKQPQ